MKVLILMGSPRKNGNTAALLAPFCEELKRGRAEVETVWLYDQNIQPCIACRACQKDWTVFGCSRADDVPELFEQILVCDLLVLATPIYAWYCTPPMKAVLDRLVYGMNKYYGEERDHLFGRARLWRCWRPADTGRREAATSLRREYAATVSTANCGIWAAMRNGTWGMRCLLWTQKKSSGCAIMRKDCCKWFKTGESCEKQLSFCSFHDGNTIDEQPWKAV